MANDGRELADPGDIEVLNRLRAAGGRRGLDAALVGATLDLEGAAVTPLLVPGVLSEGQVNGGRKKRREEGKPNRGWGARNSP